MKRIVVHVLCFMVIWTSSVPSYASSLDRLSLNGRDGITETRNVRIIHVSPEEYPAIESRLAEKGYQPSGEPMLLASVYGVNAAGEMDVLDVKRGTRGDCNEDNQTHQSGDASVNVTIDLIEGMTPDGDGVEKAVVFVVIGTVVVVVWTMYAFKFLYDVSVGAQPCGTWSELSFSTSAISSGSNRHAGFTGVHYMTGYRDGVADIGLSAEIGHSDILLTEAESLQLKGIYWLLGPVLRWRLDSSRNPDLYEMEFVAGTTEHDEVGLLAKAKAGISFGVGAGFRWGVSLGVLNINLHDNQGIITDTSRYYYLLGLEMGYRFQ